MNKLNKSPVEQQHFVWLAEYYDGTYLSEFDFEDKTENSFYDIDKNKIIRFGLVGQGVRLLFESLGGVFKAAGMMFEFVYITKDGKEYYLTGKQQFYNDIITYKNADQYINLRSGKSYPTQISQYNFGYKTVIEYDDLSFHFKPICSIPVNKPLYFNLSLMCNNDLDGYFCIKKNGKFVVEIDAKLRKNVSGNLNWVVK